MTLDPGVRAALCDIVGPGHVFLGGRGRGAAAVEPDAVVYPSSEAEVTQVIQGAAACGLTVRTAEGAVLSVRARGEIVLDLCRMNRVLSLDPRRLAVRVQPEVGVEQIAERVEAAGFAVARLPRDARPHVSDHVLAVEAVSPSGRVIRADRAPAEPGFDLVDLLISSAGVLCVVTELTLALIPRDATEITFR